MGLLDKFEEEQRQKQLDQQNIDLAPIRLHERLNKLTTEPQSCVAVVSEEARKQLADFVQFMEARNVPPLPVARVSIRSVIKGAHRERIDLTCQFTDTQQYAWKLDGSDPDGSQHLMSFSVATTGELIATSQVLLSPAPKYIFVLRDGVYVWWYSPNSPRDSRSFSPLQHRTYMDKSALETLTTLDKAMASVYDELTLQHDVSSEVGYVRPYFARGARDDRATPSNIPVHLGESLLWTLHRTQQELTQLPPTLNERIKRFFSS